MSVALLNLDGTTVVYYRLMTLCYRHPQNTNVVENIVKAFARVVSCIQVSKI